MNNTNIDNLKVGLVKKSVNSTHLANAIDAFVFDGLSEFAAGWHNPYHREMFLEILEHGMEELSNIGKITQWDVVCDSRNNKMSNINAGKYNLVVKFKQTNCVNTTQLIYELTDTQEEQKEPN